MLCTTGWGLPPQTLEPCLSKKSRTDFFDWQGFFVLRFSKMFSILSKLFSGKFSKLYMKPPLRIPISREERKYRSSPNCRVYKKFKKIPCEMASPKFYRWRALPQNCEPWQFYSRLQANMTFWGSAAMIRAHQGKSKRRSTSGRNSLQSERYQAIVKKPDKQTAEIRKSLLTACSVQGVGCSPILSRWCPASRLLTIL